MIYALVEYVNRYGKISVKGFSSKEDTDKFVEKIKGEYLVTIL